MALFLFGLMNITDSRRLYFYHPLSRLWTLTLPQFHPIVVIWELNLIWACCLSALSEFYKNSKHHPCWVNCFHWISPQSWLCNCLAVNPSSGRHRLVFTLIRPAAGGDGICTTVWLQFPCKQKIEVKAGDGWTVTHCQLHIKYQQQNHWVITTTETTPHLHNSTLQTTCVLLLN